MGHRLIGGGACLFNVNLTMPVWSLRLDELFEDWVRRHQRFERVERLPQTSDLVGVQRE